MPNAEKQAAYKRFCEADDNWMGQIKLSLSGNPGILRFEKQSQGKPGTSLNKAYQEFVAAREAYWKIHDGTGSKTSM